MLNGLVNHDARVVHLRHAYEYASVVELVIGFLDDTDYLNERVFKELTGDVVNPDPEDVKGFEEFMKHYVAGLEVEKSAIKNINW